MDAIITDQHGTVRIGDHQVHRIGLGAMRLSGDGIWGPPEDREAALAVLRDAVDWGVTLIDTADAYGPDVNEELVAEALHPYPDEVLVATKGGLTRPRREDWTPDGRPEHLREACDASLQRLRVDAIGLYQLHSPDPDVPFEESVGALADLREAGKIRHVGLSNVSVDQLATAQDIVPIASVQNAYNLTDRGADDVVDACTDQGIAFLPYVPLAAGSIQADTTSALAGTADRHDATVAQVALAWLVHRSPVIVPIPGTSSPQHLRENLEAIRIDLSDDDVDAMSSGIMEGDRARVD